MTVYALYTCGGYDLYALYSTREKALAVSQAMISRIPDKHSIIEMEVK
jgi:hypothetical protein